MRKEFCLAIAVVAAAWTTTASAGVVNVAFNGTGLGLRLNGVTANFNGGTYGGSGAWAGQLRVNVSGPGAAEFNYTGDKLVYCTELNEFAGQNTNYFIDTLNNLDIPSTPPAMTTSQKIAMERLFSRVGEVTSNVLAAGFQVAAWEISQDVSFGELLNPGAGNFFLTGSGTNFDNILGAADGFLDGLGTHQQVSVLGMVSDGSQDFVDANPRTSSINITVPEPASFAVFGAIGLIACGRRRVRKS